MPENDIKAEDLLNGASLRVVLHPDPEVQHSAPDMVESFDLPHIVIHGSEFIAKTANRHALPYDDRAYDASSASSYAFSNFLSFVINSSAAEPLFRAYSTTAYLEIEFVAKNAYETVWEYGVHETTVAVERAIEAGKRLKIALLDQDGLWNIHPVHMPSFYVGQNHFELFTEQDALPIIFRYLADLKKIDKYFCDKIEQYIETGDIENKKDKIKETGLQSADVVFYSCYYTVWPNGEHLLGKFVLRGEEPRKYTALKVFAEI